jgi:DNA polymerase-3 subunit chi
MARVDFYVLDAPGEQARHQFACRLAEKAYRLNNTVHIQTGDRQVAEQLDDLLWTFRDGSFVPHHIANEVAAERESPVTIGYQHGGQCACDLLINLTDRMPEDPGSFPRVAEIVPSDDKARQLSRERFATYREQGHSLDTHKL